MKTVKSEFKQYICILLCMYFLLTSSLFCFSQKCSRFRTGRYSYKEFPFDKTIIKRTKHYQYEVDKSDTTYLKYKVEWVNDCEYVLTFIKVNKLKHKFLLRKKIYVTIDNIIDDNCYTYYAVLMGDTTRATIIRKK